MKVQLNTIAELATSLYFDGNTALADNLTTLINECYKDAPSEDLENYDNNEYARILCDFAGSNDTYNSHYYSAYDYLKNKSGESYALNTIGNIIRNYIILYKINYNHGKK